METIASGYGTTSMAHPVGPQDATAGWVDVRPLALVVQKA